MFCGFRTLNWHGHTFVFQLRSYHFKLASLITSKYLYIFFSFFSKLLHRCLFLYINCGLHYGADRRFRVWETKECIFEWVKTHYHYAWCNCYLYPFHRVCSTCTCTSIMWNHWFLFVFVLWICLFVVVVFRNCLQHPRRGYWTKDFTVLRFHKRSKFTFISAYIHTYVSSDNSIPLQLCIFYRRMLHNTVPVFLTCRKKRMARNLFSQNTDSSLENNVIILCMQR